MRPVRRPDLFRLYHSGQVSRILQHVSQILIGCNSRIGDTVAYFFETLIVYIYFNFTINMANVVKLLISANPPVKRLSPSKNQSQLETSQKVQLEQIAIAESKYKESGGFESAVAWAATYALTHVLQHLHCSLVSFAKERGVAATLWNEDTIALTADDSKNNPTGEMARLAAMKWLRAAGCPWNSHTTTNAAKNGFLALLKYAHTNGCPVSAYSAAYAAENGHIHILDYLGSFIRFDPLVCKYAAKGGQLETLMWLRENGAPWTESVLSYGLKPSSAEIVQYWELCHKSK